MKDDLTGEVNEMECDFNFNTLNDEEDKKIVNNFFQKKIKLKNNKIKEM